MPRWRERRRSRRKPSDFQQSFPLRRRTTFRQGGIMNFRSLLWMALFAVAIPAAAQETGTLKKIRDTGEIVLGVRDASIPFSYADETGKSIGYSVDLCMRVVDHIRQVLKMPGLKVRQQLVTSANRVPLVVNGTVDLECGSTVNNLERQKTVAFSLRRSSSTP